MAQAQPSLQELIRQRTRAGFVGREAERAAFLGNFDLPPGDARHRFRFHVHGSAGVGKTFLVQELTHLARERGALTAYVDESAAGVPEALEMMCRQVAEQGRRFKDLERRLATYRERRHEAEAAALAALAPDPAPETPSAGSRAAVELGLGVLEATLPGAGLVTRALPADRLAQSADRLRAGLGARFRNPEDADLVLAPERALTPVLLTELRAAATAVPWIVLFLDTYERTGPFLDPWLHDVLTRPEEYGGLPAALVVVSAGQRPLDTARWGGLDQVADVPLAPFTETEARSLLATRGVVAEPVVEEVLRLTGGLPVLVSTLAARRPGAPDEVADPSAGAVERFLKPEPEVRRRVATVCALPRRLDADVFRVLVARPGTSSEDELDALYTWLTALPFVGRRAGRLQYHEVVRTQMLRLERRRSRTEWAARHRRLAEAFAEWREDAGFGRGEKELWADREWRELRLEEMYHLLCARPPAALAAALRELVVACRTDEVVGRRWARMLEETGEATDHPALRELGRALGEALADEDTGVRRAMDLLLARPGLDPGGRAQAHTLRARELRNRQEYGPAVEEYDRALELDPQQPLAHYGRGVTHQLTGDYPAALADLDQADRLAPGTGEIIAERAETYRLAGRLEEAAADFGRAFALDPTDGVALTGRAVCRHGLGRLDEALADFNRALGIDPEHRWALVRRSRLHLARGDLDRAFADLDRAAELAPDSAWVASERGDAYRRAGRHEEAVAELGRAVRLEPGHASALAGRGRALHELGRPTEALTDFDRAIELAPDYAWALVMRSRLRRQLDDGEGALADLLRATEAEPDAAWITAELALSHQLAHRFTEAETAYRYALSLFPDHKISLTGLGTLCHRNGSYEEALHHLDRAVAVDPEFVSAYSCRADVHLAMGRTDQALSDLDRCVELAPGSTRERAAAVRLLLWCGRLAEAEARVLLSEDPALDDVRATLHRHQGNWPEAHRTATRLHENDPATGAYHLAMTTHRSEGATAASPLWHTWSRLHPETPTLTHTILSCARPDGQQAEQALLAFLALNPEWHELAQLTQTLEELLTSPDRAPHPTLTNCLASATEARDAVRARFAE
ncbi:tetratricopeptide repeat protein [Streptomyces sp. SID13726]|uniref:tetratricopeptide repeat protein n=1 Tax=Streptomyces sp. SID13726 TaxID=2706058 RepID=UPI0013B9E5C8|nr:tetratricopeptide repeat protein [Streptomyces sp. SID13726]NEB05049.1 tetratricopeptide repeat protein [Streptomyces sp. SID13726]